MGTQSLERLSDRTERRTSARAAALEWFLPFSIFVGCFAYLCIFLRYTSLEPDEGIVLQGAERILAGQIPYRDFFSFYTPGSFYLLAGIFRVFGDSFLAARLSLAMVGALCSVVTYLLAKRVCSRGVSMFVAVLATTAGTGFRFLVLHNPYSTLGCCVFLYAAVRFLESQRWGWVFATGSLASLTFLIEQSKGAGLYVGLALGLVILRFSDREFRLRRTTVIAAAVGLVWPFAITFIYFGTRGAIGPMKAAWLWPLHHYTQANHVPYGYQNWSDQTRAAIFHSGPVGLRIVKALTVLPDLLVPILPLVSVGILIYWVLRGRKKQSDSADSPYYLLICSVLFGLLISIIISRADILHFMYLAPLWYVVLAWILGAREVRNRMLLQLRVPMTALVAISFGLLSLAVLFATAGAHARVLTHKGVIATGKAETVISYVQDHVPPRSELLVYPYLPLYNYLTGTMSPTQFDYFQPGMNTPEQATEIIASLESSNSPILFEPAFVEKIANSWPGTSLGALAADPVGNFIARNYRICKFLSSPEGWRFEFMIKREMPCS